MFEPVRGKPDFPAIEAAISQFWRDRGVYRKSLEQRRGAKRFVFFEGPPTANGLPHPGHCLTRTIKDLYPRYRTMRGEYCERKAGWDTHGLPVEVEVCKELGIHSKADIEAFGVEPFIHRCQESVWRYMKEWEALTERIGFWIDLSDAYVTYHQSFVESVWWALAELFNRAFSTRATRSSGGGRRVARHFPAARSARATAKWPTPASTLPSRCSTTRACRPTATSWPGRPRPGRFPPTSSRR
jgi:isoleucyl-tRNA synthetase